jgi:hypothetical protein
MGFSLEVTLGETTFGWSTVSGIAIKVVIVMLICFDAAEACTLPAQVLLVLLCC